MVEQVAAFNLNLGFPTCAGVVYNYGIWKPKKQRFRFIAGTRSGDGAILPHGANASLRGPPRQPLFEAHKALVKMLQAVEKTLLEADLERQQSQGVRAFWGIDSVESFTRLVRSNVATVLQHLQFTADFATMYTSFPFSLMVSRAVTAIEEAWLYHQQHHYPLLPDTSASLSNSLTLGVYGWTWGGDGLSLQHVAEFLTYLVSRNYTCNGGQIRRQIRGMPMGMPAAPQIANLACYPVEKAHAYKLGPGKTQTVCRFIDDIWSSGVPLPAVRNGICLRWCQ